MDNGSKFNQDEPMEWTIDVSELALVSESGIGKQTTIQNRFYRNSQKS